MVYPCDGILLRHEKEWSPVTFFNMENLKTFCSVREAGHKRPPINWFHTHEMSRIGKSIETEKKRVPQGVGYGEMRGEEVWLYNGYYEGPLWGWWKCFETRWRWCLYNIVNALNPPWIVHCKWWIFVFNFAKLSPWFKKKNTRASGEIAKGMQSPWVPTCAPLVPCSPAEPGWPGPPLLPLKEKRENAG